MLTRRLSWLAAPALLALICAGFYWRLILSSEFTWINNPDIVHMEVPRFQVQALRWHAGAFPLWDPYQWCGQPLLGQIVGAANPVNWPFFLLPLDPSGKMPLAVLHWYFVVIHFLGALFAYWLCRELALSRAASIAGAMVFAFNGFFNGNLWPEVMSGFLWMPLVFLFLLRTLAGRRPAASAALCGLFLGVAWLSGHHELPIYLSFTVAAMWLYHAVAAPGPARATLLRLGALAALIAILTSGLQTVPGYEYAQLAQRWVGTDHAVSWGETIPYSVDANYAVHPGSFLGLFVPWLADDGAGYLGVTAIVLALIGVVARGRERGVRLFLAVALFGLLFSLGHYNMFHGVLYAVLPLFGKTRVPHRLLSLADFAAAPLAAYGLDAVLACAAAPAVRRIAWVLAAMGGGLYAVAVAVGAVYKYEPSQHVMFAGLMALLLAAVLVAWQRGAVGAHLVVGAVMALLLVDFGIVGGLFQERKGQGQGLFLAKLTAYDDIAAFLRKQPGRPRIDFDDAFNFGDWEGIDSMRGFGAGVTSNLLQLEWWKPRTQDLEGVAYTVSHASNRPGQLLVFQGSSGFNVYQNLSAFPHVWTVHRTAPLGSAANVRAAMADESVDLRTIAPMRASAPALETCAEPDDARMTSRAATSLIVRADMACRGMVVISDTWYPGWQAAVDGRPAVIHEVYQALRGVVVPRGIHTITMRYRPRSALWGALMTASGILAACLLAALGRKA